MDALLFDLDDTLLDYSGGAEACWAEACGVLCPPRGVDSVRLVAALAETRRWFWSDPERHRRERINMPLAWEHIAAHALESLGAHDVDLAGGLAADYAVRRRASMVLFPESLPVLRALRWQGMPMGLVTNGDVHQQRDKIERFGLREFFEVIVIEGEFGAGKPNPAVYRHALARLGVAAAATAMVGDHLEFDVAGPQQLGITGIWINRSGSGLGSNPFRPDRIVRSLEELIR